jgi:hypothetical protein
MKYVTEMSSGATLYIPSFSKIVSGIQKLMDEGDTQTHREHGDCISLLLFFNNKETRLKCISPVSFLFRIAERTDSTQYIKLLHTSTNRYGVYKYHDRVFNAI